MEAFSKHLKQLRLEAALKQEDLCTVLKISQSMMSAYENGREPPYDVLISIARYFNVTTDYLLGVSQERMPAMDELTAAVTQAARAAHDHGAPAVTAAKIAALSRSLASALVDGRPGAPEVAALVRQLVDGSQQILDAIADQV